MRSCSPVITTRTLSPISRHSVTALAKIDLQLSAGWRLKANRRPRLRLQLEQEKGIRLSLRTVEREVRHLLRELRAHLKSLLRQSSIATVVRPRPREWVFID